MHRAGSAGRSQSGPEFFENSIVGSDAFPRSIERGPIEAGISAPSPRHLPTFPRLIERGPIEAGLAPRRQITVPQARHSSLARTSVLKPPSGDGWAGQGAECDERRQSVFVDDCIGIRLYLKLTMQKAGFSGFEWDEGNRRKCQEHGVSSSEIEHVLAHAETLITPDLRNSRSESRFLAIGRTQHGRYKFVAFTPRHHAAATWLRPISARYMHKREIRKYEQEIARTQK